MALLFDNAHVLFDSVKPPLLWSPTGRLLTTRLSSSRGREPGLTHLLTDRCHFNVCSDVDVGDATGSFQWR